MSPREQAQAVRLLNQWRQVYEALPLPARIRFRDLMNETITFIHTDHENDEQKGDTDGTKQR